MTNPLFSLPLKDKRDLLRARQMTRQAAHLLGFDARDQLCLAAAAFDLACQAHGPTGRAALDFQIVDNFLHVVCTPAARARRGPGQDPPAALRLTKRLPNAAPVVQSDVPWMLQQLLELAPLDLFDEIRRINQDLLTTLLEQARQRDLSADKSEQSAA